MICLQTLTPITNVDTLLKYVILDSLRRDWTPVLSLGEYSEWYLCIHFYSCIRPIIRTRIKYGY